jgi:SAM-dependent methyltransferase
VKLLTKKVRSTFDEFARRLKANAQNAPSDLSQNHFAVVRRADAQAMPLGNDAVDLVVTSPPYAGNAIDYMRAHKFSLVWLGYPVGDLGIQRGKYIGSEQLSRFRFELLPGHTAEVVSNLRALDPQKAGVLHRYYTEMTRVLKEIHRVLKPGRAAIVVVGNSVMRGLDTQIPECLCEIGSQIGFMAPMVGVRSLDRNRRMLPASARLDLTSQIQQRMHREFVIGFQKPHSTDRSG